MDECTMAGKIAEWLNSSFNIQFEKSAADSLSVSFRSLRDDQVRLSTEYW